MVVIKRLIKEKSRQEEIVSFCREKLKSRKLSPQIVQWIATHRCNFQCKHCGTAAGEARPDELTTQQILSAIDSLAKLGTFHFSVTGGEPLLREDIFEILNYAKSKGITIGMVSNGYVTQDYIEKLKRVKLDSVLISIDGYGKNHDRIRSKPGSYERCLRSLDIYRDLGVMVRGVSTVVMEENIKDVPKIIEDVWKHGCNIQRLQGIVPEGRAFGWNMSPEVVKEAFRLVAKYRKQKFNILIGEGFGFLGPLQKAVRGSRKELEFFCGCGWGTFTIMHNGDIMGCPAMDFPQYAEANIKDMPLEEIWYNKFQRFRGRYCWDILDKCKRCKYLPRCRGGCWLYMINGDPCFLPLAEEVSRELGLN